MLQCSKQGTSFAESSLCYRPGTVKDHLRRHTQSALWTQMQRSSIQSAAVPTVAKILCSRAQPSGVSNNKVPACPSDALLIISEAPEMKSSDSLLSAGFTNDRPLNTLESVYDPQGSASDYDDSELGDILVSLGACTPPKDAGEVTRQERSSPPLLGLPISECENLFDSSPIQSPRGQRDSDRLQALLSPSPEVEPRVQLQKEFTPIIATDEILCHQSDTSIDGKNAEMLDETCVAAEADMLTKMISTTVPEQEHICFESKLARKRLT